MVCQNCPRNPNSCDYPCGDYLGERLSIKNNMCFVTLLGEYYFDHLSETKQTEENLDLLWEAGMYLEKYFETCSGTKI